MRTTMRVLTGVDRDPGPLRDALYADDGLRSDGRDTIERRLLDSFDWRLWTAGAVLQHDQKDDGAWLSWRQRPTAQRPARLMGSQPSSAPPVLASDLADGPVRRLLRPVLQMRALLPRAILRLDRERFSLLDDEEKTVARAVLEHVTVVGPGEEVDADLGWRVAVTGVRGYDRALAGLTARLTDQPGLVTERDDADRSTFEAAGARPGGYTPTPRVAIAPQLPMLQAFTAACSGQLTVIDVNEPGVRADVDSEFLHDSRRAVRVTRVLLRHARGVIPDAERTRYGDAFAWIHAMSRGLRDLDVQLLGLDELIGELPTAHRADLAQLRTLVIDARHDAHRELVAALDSVRYRELLRSWRAFLDAPTAGDAASAPAGQMAAARVRKTYRNLLKHGRRIDDDTPVDAVHDVRTRVKTVRYLLAGYRAMYDERDAAPLADALARVQDDLGAVVDCETQILALRRFAELLDEHEGPTAQTMLAMGLLIDRLGRRQRRARAAFGEHLARLGRRRNRERVRRLSTTAGAVS